MPKLNPVEKARIIEEKKRLKKKEAQIRKVKEHERKIDNMSEAEKGEFRQK